jgi:hypothetical protein
VPTATLQPTPAPTPTPASETEFTRLGSHLFVPVGESRSIAGLGRFLEAVSMDGRDAFAVEATEITALTSGATCFRFMYRETPGENGIQTVCGIAFERVGECSGLSAVRLDLNAFLEPEGRPVGDANLLEYGDGLFYAVCMDEHARYVLQPSTAELPPLYWHIVDALGDGPYSLGTPELDAQRAGVVTTFSGGEIRPGWIVSASREIHQLDVTPDGITINTEDCDVVPSCTHFADTVLPGDILNVGMGLPFDTGEVLLATESAEVLNGYVERRIGIPLPEILLRDPAIPPSVLTRLLNVDIMAQIVPDFDALHRIREKGVAISFFSTPIARSIMPLCRPEPENRVECRRIEDAIMAYESTLVAGLIDQGFDLWISVGIDYREEGAYDSVAENWRPHLSAFNGVLGFPRAQSAWPTASIEESMAEAVRGLASETDPNQKVVLMSSGPPIAAQTGATGFCEAEICASDFDASYDQFEAWLAAALDAFPAGQLAGIGTALFEGSHFDIREPYEDLGGLDLNRVGETGYNHPALNIWRSR